MATDTYIAAAAALLVVSGCASSDAASRQELGSLRSEVRTLERENAELAKKVDALSAQLDLLGARLARGSVATGSQPSPVDASPAPARPAPAVAASPKAAPPAQPAGTAQAAAPVVPSNLKVVKLEAAPAKSSKSSKAPKGAGASASTPAKAPPVPTSTPIQEPSAASLALLGASGKPASDAPATLEAAMALSGLARARALEQYVDAHPGHARACDSLVEAARVRDAAGDPDGSCEDLVRAVEAYPSARSAPDAIEGLAGCEQRRGRAAEARRLQARLARDYPDSPAGKRAREHAPAAQGAAP